MDLIGVNNSVVTMRKTAVKAKIHTIRQIVKHINGLKKRKTAKEEHKAQNERKIERLRKEMNIIKHLKKDEISKFALSNKQSFLPELNPKLDQDKIDSLLSKRALVRLSNSAVMNKDVQVFRKKYPTWEQDLPKILKVLGKKQKKKDENNKKKKRLELKEKKKEAKMLTKNAGDKSAVKEISEDEELMEEADTNSSDGEFAASEEEIEENSDSEKSPEPEVIQKTEGAMEIKQLDLNELIETDSSTSEDESDEPEVKVEAKDPSAVKDSFFLGGGDDDSESDEDENEDQTASDFQVDSRMSQRRNDFFGKEFRGNFRGGRGTERGFPGKNRGGQQSRGRGQGYHRGHDQNSRGRGFNQNSRGRGFNQNSRGRGYDQNRGRGRGIDHGRGRGRDFDRSNFHSQKVESDSSALHPSWAAKRSQQKIQIPDAMAPVQNKKKTFDDDFSNKSDKPTPSNLHPSWAAKKDNKKGIQDFKGKKIVFGDDD